MARKPAAAPLHVELLEDTERLLALSDESAQTLLELVVPEGYFGDRTADALRWPPTMGESGPIDAGGLRRRRELVGTVLQGVPTLRDERLAEAWDRIRELTPRYHEGARTYLELRREFVARGEGSEDDFLRLYQSLCVAALAREELQAPDTGEASLSRAHLARVPLSHARRVAAALPAGHPEDDPRWEGEYACRPGKETLRGTLRDLLTEVARRTLDYIGAGELLATRFNTYHNFGWFGCSVWKVVVDAHARLEALRQRQHAPAGELEGLERDLLRAQAMMIEFLRAHTEDPSRLKPRGYWYGQEYSYLTRDMLDIARAIAGRAAAIGTGDDLPPVELPPLLSGEVAGRFLAYPGSGLTGRPSRLRRTLRLARWVAVSVRHGWRRRRLAARGLDEPERRRLAWQGWIDWGEATLRTFGIEVRVTVDPAFRSIAADLDLGSGRRKVLFLPTHQSLFDHPVMYRVLSSPELLQAMGWERPTPCVILARTGLATAGVKIGPLRTTMFGGSSEEFDRLLEELDGYVTLERAGGSGPTTAKIATALDRHPGIVYPMATTAAFPSQVFPFQHALFAQLPPDVVIVPIALRGIHELWPKCPRGNLDIGSGRVEAYISPPILGETTLLPKRRSLRIQMETAALFQAVHIATLLNPEPPERPA